MEILHLDIAVEDFASKPITRLSIGTNMPPPPTPPTLPNAAPKNPIIVPKIIRHPNSISCNLHVNFQLLIFKIGISKSEIKEMKKNLISVKDLIYGSLNNKVLKPIIMG